MKAKYDREGVNFIENEEQVGRNPPTQSLGPKASDPPPLTFGHPTKKGDAASRPDSNIL